MACHGNTRSPASTCERIESAGGVAHSITGDLAKSETSHDLITQTLDRFGRIDILINNGHDSTRQSITPTTRSEVIEVNLSSVFRLSKLAGKQMIENGRGGKIVNIASLLSFQGGITVPAYAFERRCRATHQALANEWAKPDQRERNRAGLHAHHQHGMTTSNATRILERIPAGRWGEPEDVAGAAVFFRQRE